MSKIYSAYSADGVTARIECDHDCKGCNFCGANPSMYGKAGITWRQFLPAEEVKHG